MPIPEIAQRTALSRDTVITYRQSEIAEPELRMPTQLSAGQGVPAYTKGSLDLFIKT